jgi:TatD DNase family protein
MSNNLVDVHCHLDLYPDFETAVERREKSETYTLSVTTTPRAWPKNRSVTLEKRYVKAALGLHPQLVAEHADQISLWKEYLSEAKYIGEVGLDAGPEHKASLEKQKEVFKEILNACADAGDKILTVHSVRAAKDVLDLIEEHLPANRGRVILHWFIGGKLQIERAINLGCYFSFNADMLQTKSGKAVAQSIPLERVLTETDAPFTNLPDIEYAIEVLAEIHLTSKENVRAAVMKNLKDLLVLNSSSEIFLK